mmetsp:Transcript_8482/g.16010  ORF Transcript_8482/g.16010 Transcript_8482/m.16010 type:complete len:147 (+) Transcript_8482:1216-1656(+)
MAGTEPESPRTRGSAGDCELLDVEELCDGLSVVAGHSPDQHWAERRAAAAAASSDHRLRLSAAAAAGASSRVSDSHQTWLPLLSLEVTKVSLLAAVSGSLVARPTPSRSCKTSQDDLCVFAKLTPSASVKVDSLQKATHMRHRSGR